MTLDEAVAKLREVPCPSCLSLGSLAIIVCGPGWGDCECVGHCPNCGYKFDLEFAAVALEQLNHLYGLVRLYVNCFQPTMKLQHKTRQGAKVHKVYDTARTPYQRLLDTGVLATEGEEALERLYHSLNPLRLRQQIDGELERLWNQAEHPQRKEVSVTPIMRQPIPVR